VRVCAEDDEVQAWLITDHRALRRYGIGAVPPFPGRLAPFIASGYLVAAPDARTLGQRLGIDGEQLARTVEAFNRDATHGIDLAFGKGGDEYGRANGDAGHRPNPCLAPIEHGPMYAVRIVPGDLGTFAGLRTDGRARVLDEKAQPIEGLYACGSDKAHAFGGAYPGAGVGVGSAMTFAYLAGREVTSTA
jgi:predicted oxidoreductase